MEYIIAFIIIFLIIYSLIPAEKIMVETCSVVSILTIIPPTGSKYQPFSVVTIQRGNGLELSFDVNRSLMRNELKLGDNVSIPFTSKGRLTKDFTFVGASA